MGFTTILFPFTSITLILVFFNIISPSEITSTLLPLIFAVPDGLSVVMATPSADNKLFSFSLADEKPSSEAFTANVLVSSLYHVIKKMGIKQMPIPSKICPSKFDTYK